MNVRSLTGVLCRRRRPTRLYILIQPLTKNKQTNKQLLNTNTASRKLLQTENNTNKKAADR